MKTVYIHIGLGKTGTSFLQSVFARNAELYKSHGLIYPDLCNNIAMAASGATTSGNALPVAAYGLPALADYSPSIGPASLLGMLDPDFNQLLSSEWLSGCPLEYLMSLQETLSRKFNVKFIAAVRNPAEHIVAAYQEGLKNTTYRYAIETYIEELIGHSRRMYRLLLDLKRSLLVLNYDINRNNLIGRFDRILFGGDVSSGPAVREVNRSPDASQTSLLQLASQLGLLDTRSARRYIQLTHEPGALKYLLPPHLSARVFEELSQEIEGINRMLPEHEAIERRSPEGTNTPAKSFRAEDVAFLSELIQNKIAAEKRTDLAFIASCATQADETSHHRLPDGFDSISYLIHNPDLIAARVDPIEHFLAFGEKEGRRYR